MKQNNNYIKLFLYMKFKFIILQINKCLKNIMIFVKNYQFLQRMKIKMLFIINHKIKDVILQIYYKKKI